MGTLTTWQPEDTAFWEQTGRRVAARNLAISVPCLLMAFAVWMMWSVLTVQMENVGFPFTKEQLYTLTAIAGLSGATLRIPNSFLIAIGGGRNVVALTTGLLIVPAVGAGLALGDPRTPYSTFCLLAALSGIGGGNFASSMSNINPFYPKCAQGAALGINAGVGNLGVSIAQKLLPVVMGAGLFGGAALTARSTGASVWIHNGGWVWVAPLVLLTVLAALRMDNLPQFEIGGTAQALGKTLWLLALGGVATAVGVGLLLRTQSAPLAILATVALTLLPMRYLTPPSVRERVQAQFAILSNKHTWLMTLLYIMTFGSFIGFGAAFPKLMQDLFNQDMPGVALRYGWLGPLVGSLARPLGGWISDRWGGAKVTQVDTLIMIVATVGAGLAIATARASTTPAAHFTPFMLWFLLLFVTTGIGNGSTFRMVPFIFEPTLAGPVLGWTSAIAAYGACVIPDLFRMQIKAGHPERAMYACAAFYVVCLAVNGWFYARRGAEKPC